MSRINRTSRVAPGKTRNPEPESRNFLPAHPAFICILLAVVTFALFWPVRDFDFISLDDSDYVTANPHVKAGLTRDGVVWAFGIGRVHNWHPLTWLSHMLDAQLFGPGAAPAHIINVLFHIANSILLFLLLRNVTGAHWRSALVAALFAWHPLHVESVAWISERKDVLSTLFWLLTLWAYSGYARKRLSGESASRMPAARSPDYFLALLFFTLGLMAKPMLVTLPFVMLLWDYWPLGRSEFEVQGSKLKALAGLVVEKIPFFALSAASCIVTVLAQTKAIQNFTYFPLAIRIENAFVSYARYLGKMFWPVDLTTPYPPHLSHWPVALAIFAVALVVGCSLAAFWAARKFPFVVTGWFWFLGTLVPVIGLVQVGIQSLADRYTYVPLIGIFIIVSWGAGIISARLAMPKYARSAIAAATLVICAALTRGQLLYWQNSETLFRRALAVNPEDPLANYSLGFHLFEKGRVEEAIVHYRKAIRANPVSAELWSDLGAALDQIGRTTEATEALNKALEISRNDWLAHYRLANVMTKSGQPVQAIEHYQLAVQNKPDSIEARNNLAVALFKASRAEEAIEQFRAVIRYQPTNATAYFNLARSLAGAGHRDEAITNLNAALRFQPDFAPAQQLRQSLGGK